MGFLVARGGNFKAPDGADATQLNRAFDAAIKRIGEGAFAFSDDVPPGHVDLDVGGDLIAVRAARDLSDAQVRRVVEVAAWQHRARANQLHRLS